MRGGETNERKRKRETKLILHTKVTSHFDCSLKCKLLEENAGSTKYSYPQCIKIALHMNKAGDKIFQKIKILEELFIKCVHR